MTRRTGKKIDSAIKRTLAYRSLFQYPMSFYQLGTYLMSAPTEEKKLRQSLNNLVKSGWAKKRYGKYEIRGEKYTNWLSKKKHAARILSDNYSLLQFIGTIPWIKMVAVTGSLAAYNPEKKADIDIMIVTAPNRVWITRGFVALILKILGKHPKFDGQPGSFCTNLFLDGAKMQWEKEKRNVFIASDIVMMQPIINKENTYFRFIKENKWVFDYYPNFKVEFSDKDKPYRTGRPFGVVENIARKAQLRYMRKKVTKEVLGKHIIHFNKNDNSERIIGSYENLLKTLKIS